MSQTISLESPVASPAIWPGWPEILSGVVVFVMVGFGGGALLVQSKLDPIIVGLMLAALSGAACLVGFAVAALVRIRTWSAFGVRPVPLRWLAIGVGAGLVAFIAKGFAIMAFIALTGQDANPQDIYATGASGGISTVILSTLFVGILTPIGGVPVPGRRRQCPAPLWTIYRRGWQRRRLRPPAWDQHDLPRGPRRRSDHGRSLPAQRPGLARRYRPRGVQSSCYPDDASRPGRVITADRRARPAPIVARRCTRDGFWDAERFARKPRKLSKDGYGFLSSQTSRSNTRQKQKLGSLQLPDIQPPAPMTRTDPGHPK